MKIIGEYYFEDNFVYHQLAFSKGLKLTNFYKPKFESGINLLDRTLNIKWPGKKFKISKKDKKLGSFKDFLSNHNYL